MVKLGETQETYVADEGLETGCVVPCVPCNIVLCHIIFLTYSDFFLPNFRSPYVSPDPEVTCGIEYPPYDQPIELGLVGHRTFLGRFVLVAVTCCIQTLDLVSQWVPLLGYYY